MAAVVAEVMVAATVIERVVYYIVTGAGRIRPAVVFGPLWGRKIGTGKGPMEQQSKGKAGRAGEIR